MRLAIVFLGLAACTPLFATNSRPSIQATEIPAPANRGSSSPSFATDPRGEVWLTWIEPGAVQASAANGDPGLNALRFSTFDPQSRRWREPRTIIADASLIKSGSDTPQLAIAGDGTAHVLWADGRGAARHIRSHDDGATWTAPTLWTQPGQDVENPSLVRLGDGRVLAAWLDGRGRLAGGKAQQLYARVVGASASADQLVDASVCDCCQTVLTAFADGGALLGYRGRSQEEVRDILVARFRERDWSKPATVSRDGWRIPACPVNGPRLASDGSRVAAAWYTAADREPRVLVSFSPDAGSRWLMPLRVDRGHPLGHVDALLLRDGAVLVTWLESDGSLWLRRITPEFTLTEPVELAPKGAVATQSVPRIALLNDYRGGQSAAQLLVAFVGAAETGIRTLLLNIPEGDLVNAERNCPCAPPPELLRGYPMRGIISRVDERTNQALVAHTEVPGVLAAGTHAFLIDPMLLTELRTGRDFLGRIEREGADWRLSSVAFLGTPTAVQPRSLR